MGFDNECILNIQSLPGEYFCPVCRTLIYPNEALQSQCTHLYCKPCLAYVVASTRACPYDGYLVTEADSKPLLDSNKSLAETIGKVAVNCLYHRSGCQWQGGLSECIAHCTECSFGNSPVLCNRCGAQIMHRQVQEHGQTCLGVQPQAQQVETQAQASTGQGQAAAQDQSLAASAAPASAPATAVVSTATPTTAVAAPASVPASVSGTSSQGQSQDNAIAYPQTMAQAPTPEQWYHQQQLQYQQYYQQYPGYPYQQQYQQYVQYQQQSHPQYPQSQVAPQQVIQGQQQPQPYMVPPPSIQAQAQAQAQQPQLHQHHPSQSQPQPHPHHPHVQHAQMQAQLQLPVQQPHPQAQPQGHPPLHAQVAGQQSVQPHTQPHHPQPQLQQQAQPLQLQAVPQHQQTLAPQQHPHPQPQPQPLPLPQPQPQQQLQPLPLQAAPQHQQHAPPQQHPHPQIQHPQPHPQLLPHQPHTYAHPHPQPQLQQHHIQLQPQPHSQLLTQPQPQPQPQPQSIPQQLQHSSAHAVSGHKSYPQPQSIQQIPPSAPPQHPMHTNHHQQGMPHQHPQHPVQTQNQVPPQQLAHMRPLHAPSPMQLAPQGPHPPQQAHHQVLQPAQQIQQHPGMPPQLQQHGSLPGQPKQQGPLPSQHLMHPQHSVRSQAPLYMQQHVPAQPSPQQKFASVQNLPVHQIRNMPQLPPQQSTGGPTVLLQSGVNQQSSNQRYPVKGTSMPMPSEPQPGSMLQSQHTYSGNQGSLTPASPAPQSGVIARQIPAARATSESVSLDKTVDSTSENAAYVPVLEAGMVLKKGDGTEASDLTHTQVEGSESAELKLRKHGSDSKSEGNESEEIAIAAVAGRNVQPNADRKDVVHAKAEIEEEPVLKPVKKEEATESPNEGPISSNVLKASEGNNGVQSPEVEPHGKLGARVEGENLNLPDGTGTVKSLPDSNNVVKLDFSGSPLEKTNQCLVSQGQIDGNATSNIMHTPQQSRQHVPPANERSFPQPGHNERNLSQFPQQGPSTNDLRRMRPPGPVPGHERYPAQHGHYPTMPDPAMISHRPPAPNEMFPQNMQHHGPIQEQMFQEPSHQVQVHGQGSAPSHLRPMAPNFPEPLHWQPPVSEQFQPPLGQQPYGSHRSEPPHAGLQGPVLPTSSARVPGPTGLVQKGFDELAMSQGQSQNHMPPSHAGGARVFQEGPMARSGTGGPPSGMLVRGPPLGPEDHSGWTHPSAVEADVHAIRQPNFFDGRQHEPRHHVPGEHASVGQSHIQPNSMVMNGIPGKVRVGGMPDSGSSQGLAGERFRLMPEGRFKPLTEEGFKALQSDQFRPSPLNPGSHTGNQLWFEDLKQFPRPGHLDGEGAPRFDGYRGPHSLVHDSMPRPLDRFPRGSDGGAGALPPRLLPPYQSSFPFPSSGSAPHSVGIGERQWPAGSHEDLGRMHNLDATHPDLLRPVREFGHHPIMDSLPPLRSPGREQASLPPNQFRSGSQPLKEDFLSGEPRGLGERMKGFNVSSGSVGSGFLEKSFPIPPTSTMPGYLRKGDTEGPGDMRMSELQSVRGLLGPRRMDMNDSENLHNHLLRGELHGHGLSTNSQGGEFGFKNLPHHLRVGESLVQVPSHESEPTGFGGFQSQLRRDPAGPGNLPSHLRTGEHIGGGGSYPNHGFPNESVVYSSVESLDYLRMRKPGSTGWCRICKLDCETIEGLDLHSQTREHQKMAMDLVLSIKRESNKRPKLSSEGNVPREDGNKIKLPSFESSVNRH